MKPIIFIPDTKLLVMSGILGFLCLFDIQSLASPFTSTDTTIHKISHIEAEERLYLLEKLIPQHINKNPALALKNSREALELAKSIGNKRMKAIALHYIGNSLRYLTADYSAALRYGSEALEICVKNDLQIEQTMVLLTLGDIYKEQGNSFKAIENFMQAQVIATRLHNLEYVVEAMNATGMVYSSIGNAAKAIEYHGKALSLCRQHQFLSGISNSYYCLAMAYQQIANLELAHQKHDSALSIRRQINDLPGMGESYLALAQIYQQKNDFLQARSFVENALQIFQQLDFSKGKAKAFIYIGNFHLQLQQYKDALPFLLSALDIGEQLNDKKIIRDSYENLYSCYSGLKNYEQALQYKDLFIAISDFIYGEESERRMVELQTRFEIAEKEREIETLRQENVLRELAMQKQANFRDSLITGMVLLLIILLLLFYLYRINRRNNLRLKHTNITINQQNNELQELNATKDKFFSIISHDLKGPLNSLSAFSNLLIKHTDALSKEEIQMLAVDFDKSLKNLLSLLENLLEWSRTQTGGIEINPEPINVRELVKINTELLKKMADNKGIQIETTVASHLWAYAGRNQMNTVLRNLISNAVKFTPQGGKVDITATESDKELEVSVMDTGVGLSPEEIKKLFKIEHKHTTLGTAQEKGTGLGLMLCKEFVEQNGGSIQVESKVGEGSSFRIRIPKAAQDGLHLTKGIPLQQISFNG